MENNCGRHARLGRQARRGVKAGCDVGIRATFAVQITTAKVTSRQPSGITTPGSYTLCPPFGGKGVVQFIGVMTALELDVAGFRVRPAVGEPSFHAVALV